jgi:predicted amidohydrolase YtcJ
MRSRRRSGAERCRLAWLGALAAGLTSARTLAATDADIVLVRGKVYTADAGNVWAQAVAIRGGRIVAVGPEGAVTPFIGAATRVIDLQGSMLMPGLIDTHAHPLAGGRQMSLATVDGKPLTIAQFREFVDASIANGKALQGGRVVVVGIHASLWSEDLGAVFNRPPYSDRAILFAGADAHTGWANAKMLGALGLTRESISALSPEERRYYTLDARGEPTGFAVEEGASNLFRGLPGRDGAYLRKWGTEAIRYYHERGVTAVLEANAGHWPSDGEAILKLYEDLARSGDLTLRVAALLEIQEESELEPAYRLRDRYTGLPNFSIVGLKLFADGILDYPAQTGAVSTPYIGSGQNTGVLKIPPEMMSRIVSDADRHDMLVHIHAIGDRAVTEALDAIAAARAAPTSRGMPHSIAHLHLIAPRDIPRFTSLQVIASFQLLWAAVDQSEQNLIRPYLTAEAWTWQYPARSVLVAGGIVAGGSDWPVSSGNPWEAIAQAMTREGEFGVLNAAERMPLEAMLQAYTINGARALRLDRQIGSIEVGKEADLVLLDRDVTLATPSEISRTLPRWTMVHGKIVASNE